MMKTTAVAAGVFAVLYCSQSVAAAPKSSDAKSSGKPTVSAVESDFLNEKKATFAAQDKLLKKADDLAKNGKLLDAIKHYKNVKFELSLEDSERDSWVVKRRFNEVSARLRELELAYGNMKLAEAEKALEERRYNVAISLVNDAIQVCQELLTRGNRIKTLAVSRQKSDELKKDIAPDTVVPELKTKETAVEKFIAEAKVLMKYRQYEDARRRVEEVFKINPFNQEAAYLLSQIYSEYYTAGYHRSVADLRAMLAVEEWTWVEPVFYQKALNENPTTTIRVAGDQAIQQKLDKIILPEVTYSGQSVSAVLRALERQSRQNDPDYNDKLSDDEIAKLGVIIDYSVPGKVETAVQTGNAGNNADGEGEENADGNQQNAAAAAQNVVDASEIEVNFSVKNASLRDVLDYISFLTDLPYHVTPTRVKFGTRSADIRREVFDINADAVKRISGDTGNVQETEAGGDADGENTDTSNLAVSQEREVTISSEDLKNFFKEFGISFDAEGSAISYSPGKLTMYNTPDNIKRMVDTLKKLNTTKELIQIELKSIELSEEDYEDLGFEWSLTPSSVNPNNHTTVGQGANAALSGPVHFVGNALGRTGSLVSGLNLFPDIFGSWKPFGIDQTLNISLTIQALDQNECTETISAPQVTVANGQQGTIKLNTTYFFPESWKDLEVDFETSDGDTIRTVTPPMPEFGDETAIGTTLIVTPTIRNNTIINLRLSPTIAAWVGKDREIIEAVFGERANENADWVYTTENYEIWKPQIATRNFSVDVNVYDGETLVIGGLASSELETRLDKIPILGDLPLIGRLFQRQSEISKRSNMLFFVTARKINESGVQQNRIKNSGGIPDVNR